MDVKKISKNMQTCKGWSWRWLNWATVYIGGNPTILIWGVRFPLNLLGKLVTFWSHFLGGKFTKGQSGPLLIWEKNGFKGFQKTF